MTIQQFGLSFFMGVFCGTASVAALADKSLLFFVCLILMAASGLILVRTVRKEREPEIEQLRTALKQSMTAIDDWLNDYAAELCDEARVAEARSRISEYGTIGYIAHVQEKNRAALNGDA